MQEIFVPALGMASDSVYLAEWIKQPGDAVSDGDVIALIETDKSNLDVEATSDGVLGAHRFPENSEVPLGEVITVILEPGETEDGTAAPPAPPAAVPEPLPEASSPVEDHAGTPIAEATAAAADDPQHEEQAGEVLRREDRRRDPATGHLTPYTHSPRARREALHAPEPVPSPTSATTPEPLSEPATDRYRAAVSEAVSRSWAEIPHFAVQRELRVEPLFKAKAAMSALQSSVTLSDVLLKAYALSLMEHFDTREIHLGLAVATDRGVAIPVLRDVARRDVLAIAAQRSAAVERARASRSNSDDALTPHSTLSNLGAHGVRNFTAIVPHGQTSILSVGTAEPRPVVEDGQLTVGTTMVATLNVDHRSWDGEHAAKTLAKLAAIIAEPLLLTSLNA